LKSYPNILGQDVAGEVHEVGEGVQHVKKGDRVMGYAFSCLLARFVSYLNAAMHNMK
jgi:NADPH:quinone reductase-like Zn-dependent oxidoreductase